MKKDKVLEQPKRILKKISNLNRDQQLLALGAISMLEAAQISDEHAHDLEQRKEHEANEYTTTNVRQ